MTIVKEPLEILLATLSVREHAMNGTLGLRIRTEGATGELVTRTVPQTVTFPEWKGEFNNLVNVTEGTVTLRE